MACACLQAFRTLRDVNPNAKEEAVMLLEAWKEFEASQDWRWGWTGACAHADMHACMHAGVGMHPTYLCGWVWGKELNNHSPAEQSHGGSATAAHCCTLHHKRA